MNFPELFRPRIKADDLYRLLVDSAILTPEQFEREAGTLRGLVRGIKPGVFVSSEIAEAVAVVLRRNGLEVVTDGGLLYRQDLVEQRIQNDPSAVSESRWEADKSILDNVSRTSASAREAVGEQLRMGFVLGYPATALREYGAYQTQRNAGWPALSDVWRLADGLDGDKNCWSEVRLDVADFAMLATIKDVHDRLRDDLAALPTGPELVKKHNEANAVLAESTKTEVLAFIRKHFANRPGYSNELSARLVNTYPRVVQLYDEAQWPVYSFMVFSDEAQFAPDVQALRERVAESDV